VLGLLVTQAIGLWLSTPTKWRLVLLISSSLAVVQLLLSPFATESPAWLSRRGLVNEQMSVSQKLWGVNKAILHDRERSLIIAYDKSEDKDSDLEDPLLEHSELDHPATGAAVISVPQLLRAAELRRPLLIVSLAMGAQQLSGKDSD
jgi:MFS family permease